MQNVQAAINLFISRGWITSTTPVFANGVSNGGGFAPLVSRTLNFRATSIYISSGLASVMPQTTVPTIYNLMQNDRVLGANGIAQAYSYYQNLLARGVRAQYNVLTPSPVFPERFRRIAGLTAADSQNIYNALKQNGFLDARDFLINDPASSNWRNVIPSQYASYLTEISSQLTVCYAQHMFYSDYNRRVLDFFNASR